MPLAQGPPENGENTPFRRRSSTPVTNHLSAFHVPLCPDDWSSQLFLPCILCCSAVPKLPIQFQPDPAWVFFQRTPNLHVDYKNSISLVGCKDSLHQGPAMLHKIGTSSHVKYVPARAGGQAPASSQTAPELPDSVFSKTTTRPPTSSVFTLTSCSRALIRSRKAACSASKLANSIN